MSNLLNSDTCSLNIYNNLVKVKMGNTYFSHLWERTIMHKLNYLLTLSRTAIAFQAPTSNADMLCLISLCVSNAHRCVTMTASAPCSAAADTKQRLGFILSQSEWDIQGINNTSQLQRGVPDFLEFGNCV